MAREHPESEEILAQAAWARRVALALVRDEHRAEDLAQDAMESGLRRKQGAARNLRAWLHGALRNLHRQTLRGERRRREREARTPAPEPGLAASEIVERLEAQKEMSSAVLRLPEPCREAIVLRYYEELPIRDVARALGIADKAAEARIYRGLELLRADLQGRFGHNMAGILAPLVGTVSLPPLTTLAGPLLMTSKSKLAVAAVLAITLLASLASVGGWWDPPATIAPNSATGPADPRTGAGGEGLVASAPEASQIGRDEPILARAGLQAGVTLRVVDEAGNPISGAEVLAYLLPGRRTVSVAGLSGPSARQHGYRPPDLCERTDKDGRVLLCSTSQGYQGVVLARADGFVWRAIAVPDEQSPLLRDLGDLVLGRGGFLAFRCLDKNGHPVVDKLVAYRADLPNEIPGLQSVQELRTDERGEVHFNSLPLGTGSVGVSPPDYLPWYQERIQVARVPVTPTDIQLDQAGSAQLSVTDADGRAVPRAEVFVFQYGRGGSAMTLTRNDASFLGETDAAGVRTIQGLTGSRSLVVLARAGPAWNETRLEEPGTMAAIQLPRLRTLSGRFLWKDGRPVAGGLLSLIDASSEADRPDVRELLSESGEFSLALRESLYGLAVWHAEGSRMLEEAILLNQDLDLGSMEVTSGLTVTFTVLDARSGLPVSQPQIVLDPGRGTILTPKSERWKRTLSYASANAGGFVAVGDRVVSRHLSAGEHRLSIHATGYVAKPVTLTLEPEEAREVRVELMPEARLQLTVLDEQGVPVVGERIEIAPEGLPEFWWQADPPLPHGSIPFTLTTNRAGQAEYAGLQAGLWHLGYNDRVLRGYRLASLDLPPGQSEHTLRLPAPVNVSIEVLAQAEPVPGAKIQFKRELPGAPGEFESGGLSCESDAQGKAAFVCKEPGNYQVLVSAPMLLPMQIETNLAGPARLLQFEFTGVEVSGRLSGGASDAQVMLLEILNGERPEEEILGELLATFREFGMRYRVPLGKQHRHCTQRPGPDSTFSMKGVPPGNYWLLAGSSGWLQGDPVRITVGENGLRDQLLTLTPAAQIVVEVIGVLEFRAENPGVSIQLEFESEGRKFRGEPSTLERDGECSIRQPPAAPGTIVVYTYGELEHRRIRRAEIPVAPGSEGATKLAWDARSLLAQAMKQ